MAGESLRLWSRVRPATLPHDGSVWLRSMLGAVRAARSRSRRTSASFVRLQRALETGHTLPPLDGGHHAGRVTLGALRADWAQHTGQVRHPEADDGITFPVDDFEWPEEDFEADEDAARASLAVTGIVRPAEALRTALDSHPGRLDDPAFLASLESDLQHAGAVAAGAADREALRGGRSLIEGASQRDRRAVGWARVTDGDPCAFCSMLASRGAVYSSRAAAGLSGYYDNMPIVSRMELTKYHNNCHCQTVPVYRRDDFMHPDSVQLRKEWDRVTAGLRGEDAVRAYRRYIDAQRRSRRATT